MAEYGYGQVNMRAQRGRFVGPAFIAASLLSGAGAMPAQAQTPARVIELFTSQGCSKCPPADRLIAEFAHDPNTVALSFPVNYWDYIGWKDTLASSAFTHRQHAYAAARGDGLVYTPQVVVDGLGAQPGTDKAAILRATDRLKGDRGAMTVPIQLAETDGRLHIAIGAGDRAGGDAVGVYVLRVAREKTVDIDRGENSGRSVTYTNVVRAMNRIGNWTGSAESFDMLDLKSEDEGYVVLLQAGSLDRPGAILAAAKSADL